MKLLPATEEILFCVTVKSLNQKEKYAFYEKHKTKMCIKLTSKARGAAMAT